MKWVDASPTARTAFEQFMFSNFGKQIDLSHSNTLAILGIVAVFAIFVRVFWGTAVNR